MASSRVVNRIILYLLLAGALLSMSCQGSSFTVLSAELSHETRLVVSEESVLYDRSAVVLSFSSSVEDEYTFSLVSPSGDMSWEGAFSCTDGEYVSEELLVSSSASFEKGLYSYYIYSSKEQERSGELRLDYTTFSGPFFDESGFIEQSGLSVNARTEDSITGTDSYGGSVTIERM